MRFWLGHKPRSKGGPPPKPIVLTPVRKVDDLPGWAWTVLDEICAWPTARRGDYPHIEFVGGWS